MDDLTGTQSPTRRLEDPEEALMDFARVAPELAALRRPEPVAVDWAVIESNLGTGLPPDFSSSPSAIPG